MDKTRPKKANRFKVGSAKKREARIKGEYRKRKEAEKVHDRVWKEMAEMLTQIGE